MLSHVAPHFIVTFPARAADGGLAAHLHARLFKLQRKVQNAEPLLFKLLWNAGLAADDVAIHKHDVLQLSSVSRISTGRHCTQLFVASAGAKIHFRCNLRRQNAIPRCILRRAVESFSFEAVYATLSRQELPAPATFLCEAA